jgi:hypothetical protein
LQLLAVDFQRQLFAVFHHDLSLDDFLGAQGANAEGRAFDAFDIAPG